MRHYYCGSCLRNFDFSDNWLIKLCPLCDKPTADITAAVKDKQRFLQEAQDFAAQQTLKKPPELPTQMRGIRQLYTPPHPGWKLDAKCYGVTVRLDAFAKPGGLRFSAESPYMNPFVDMERAQIISLASYLVDYLERTQEKV